MRFLFASLAAPLALAACGQAPSETPVETESAAPAVSESERLTAWFDEKFEEQLAFSPVQQTLLGRKTNYDKLDDPSWEAQKEQLDWRRASVAELQSEFDYDALTPEAKASYDIWVYNLERAEAAWSFRKQAYAFDQMTGSQSGLPSLLLSVHRVDNADDMRAFISRLREIGRYTDQKLAQAEESAAIGVRAPRFAFDGVIDQARKVIIGAPFTDGDPSALWADVLSKTERLESEGEITAEEGEALRADARAALTDVLQPSYERLIAWHEAELENTDAESKGVWALPDGEAYYNSRLAAMTTTDLTADQIHEIGLSEVARIRGEMEAIKTQTGFEGSLEDFFVFMREDDQFYFSDDDAGAEAYIDAAKGHLAFIDSRLPEYFGILPKAELEVRRVEPFRERDGAAQHYRRGSPDGSRPGIYYAHLSDMRAMPIPTLEVIAYHEGSPGHHMQISIAQELTGLPVFRTQAGYSVYSEGWGLYSELLAKEMGAYADPYSDFGRLTTEIWRAIRLVVDTGIHAKQWSEEEAVEYFMANSPVPEAAVRSEIQRYFVIPGQATAYKVGMLKILDLRAKAEGELGDAFDIRGFHDTVLGGGAMPLDVLEARVDRWIASQKAA